MSDLTRTEKQFLLQLAREKIVARCQRKKIPEKPFFSEPLKEKLGVFVSLHSGGELRGCIGYIKGIRPLQQAVAEMAESAAFHDPRFLPVSGEEIDTLEIEISVLSKLDRVDDISEIKVGSDGLLIERGLFSGLLLPQVATEMGWDRETFLSQTCRKAGLPAVEWKSGKCTIYKFTAEIFSESSL
jgi:AmmeMemoRadiSam system protein A